jgi:hypothetical protein
MILIKTSLTNNDFLLLGQFDHKPNNKNIIIDHLKRLPLYIPFFNTSGTLSDNYQNDIGRLTFVLDLINLT